MSSSHLFTLYLIVATAAFAETLEDPPGVEALQYRSVGPAWAGRMSKVAGVPGTNILYAGAATGGLWKSINSGLTWQSILDGQNECCVGSLALAPSNPNIIYVGGGEANIRGVVVMGHGIYKSEDAGKTWSHVWKQTGQIGAMAVHPKNPNIAFAAVLGHAFGPNSERGIYRTVDGGRNWSQVLKKDENTGGCDIAIDPANPNHLMASLWQTRRTPWSMVSGGTGSGLFESEDTGATWKEITGNGLPPKPWGKIGVAFAPSRSGRIFTLIETTGGGVFRSENNGATWTQVSNNSALLKKAYYFGTLIVNPVNADEIWFPQRDMFRSRDGGKTFSAVPGTRNGDDMHDVWIDPTNPLHILTGLDSGVQVTLDGGKVWYTPPIPLGQFYNIDLDSSVPYRVAGTLQDLGSTAGPSNNLDYGGIRNSEWQAIGGGEAGGVSFDPADPNIVYAGNYGSNLTRFDERIVQAPNISIYPVLPQGVGAKDLTYRFQYTAPLAISPFNPKVLYHGANVLFKSEDEGISWKVISGDLTRNDKSKQERTSGLFGFDNVSVEFYCTIFAIAPSPLDRDLIWIGSDDGLVHVTRDGGKTWRDVTSAMPGVPKWGTITTIEASHFAAGTAYVTVDANRLDNFEPYLFKTTDYGETWKRLDQGLPRDTYLRVVREDSKQADLLFLGTSDGIAFSIDGGHKWESLKLNLPPVPVYALKVRGDSLAVGTYGRSLWIFDDIAALRQLRSEPRQHMASLWDIPDSVRWRYSLRVALPSFGGLGTPDLWKGKNPPPGVRFYYWLPEQPKAEVKVEVFDLQHRLVSTLSSNGAKTVGFADNMPPEKSPDLSKHPGLNVGIWNMTYSGAEGIPDSKIKSGDPTVGPMILAGTYILEMTVDGHSESKSVQISMDPRVHLSEADLKARLDLALSVRGEISRITHLVETLREFRNANRSNGALVDRLDDLEARIHNVKAHVVYDLHSDPKGVRLYAQLIYLYSTVTEGDAPVTQGIRETFASDRAQLNSYEEELRVLMAKQK